MSKEEGGGGGGGEAQAQYVGPYRLEKTLGKGQTGEWSFIQERRMGRDAVVLSSFANRANEVKGMELILMLVIVIVGLAGRGGGSIVVTSVPAVGQLTPAETDSDP